MTIGWGYGLLLAAQTTATDSNEVWEGWGSVALVEGSALAIFGLIAVLIWQGARIWQTKLSVAALAARDEAYRKLAEEATATQRQLAEDQHRVVEELTALRVRMTAVERLLREVE